MDLFWVVVRRDLLLVSRYRAEILNPLLFFIIIVALFPLAVSPQASVLSQSGHGAVWVAALLATLLSLDLLFKSDHDDGSLEQFLIVPKGHWSFVLAKVLVHWLISGLPLVLLTPVVALMVFLPLEALPALMLSLLISTPILSLVGAVGAALVIGLRNGGMLIALLVLPLYIPVLIFGAGAVSLAIQGLPYSGNLALLGALLIFALMVTPWATISALKISQM